MILGGIQVPATLLTALVIEKLGRKFFLIISEALICISMIGVGIFFKMKEDCTSCPGDAMVFASKETVESYGWLPLVCLMVFLIAFSIGIGPVPWVMNIEMMPPEARVSHVLPTPYTILLCICLGYHFCHQHILQLAGLLRCDACRPSSWRGHRDLHLLLYLCRDCLCWHSLCHHICSRDKRKVCRRNKAHICLKLNHFRLD